MANNQEAKSTNSTTAMPQRHSVLDYEVDSLPKTFDRFTLLDEPSKYKMVSAISKKSLSIAEKLLEDNCSSSRSENYKQITSYIRRWCWDTMADLQGLFMALVFETKPRVDQYSIERTIAQIVRCGAYLAAIAHERLKSSRVGLSDAEIHDLTRLAQEEIDHVLCLWVDDFRDWAEPRRLGDVEHEEPTVRLCGPGLPPIVRGKQKKVLNKTRYNVISALVDAGPSGLTKDELVDKSGHGDARGILERLLKSDTEWAAVIVMPKKTGHGYKLRF